MSDMVERVARAMTRANYSVFEWTEKQLAEMVDRDWYVSIPQAQAAIAAMQADAAPVAMVRVTNGGYAMSLAQYVAYSLPEGDHWLYAHPPVVARVSTSNPVVDHETGNTSDKLRAAEEVADDCWGEAEFCNIAEAAAIIEADRQATRAALVAEIVAWLREAAPQAQAPLFAELIEAKWGKQ